MLRYFILLVVCPVLAGAWWALLEQVRQSRGWPISLERRRPWPNPFS
jgi:hypothetical protein